MPCFLRRCWTLSPSLFSPLPCCSLNNPALKTPELKITEGDTGGGLAPEAGIGIAYLHLRSPYAGMQAVLEGAVRGVARAVSGVEVGMQRLSGAPGEAEVREGPGKET